MKEWFENLVRLVGFQIHPTHHLEGNVFSNVVSVYLVDVSSVSLSPSFPLIGHHHIHEFAADFLLKDSVSQLEIRIKEN